MALVPSNDKSREDKKAERQAAQDDVLMREIDDAVRQDDYARFAKIYGRPLLGLLVAGLLAFGGYLFWDSRQEAAMEKTSEDLVSAIDQLGAGNFDSANDAAATLASESKGGAKAAAMLMQAGIAMEKGDLETAAGLYAQVAQDNDAPQAVRDLALIRENAAGFDARDPADVIAALKPLAVPGNAYFGSAGELVAMAYLEQGEREQAGTLFAAIAKDEDVPQSLRARTRQMAGLLGVDAIEDVDELLESQEVGDAANADAASGQ